MAEKIFEKQQNYGWGLTLNMTGKAPAVAKRIFNTLTDAQAYADDVKDSAIEGLVLSVVADGDKNGVYFVQSIKTSGSTKSAVLVKLGSASDAADGASDALNEAKKYTDQEVKKLADGAVATNTANIANEVAAREQAISSEVSAREAGDNAIKATIGEVATSKTVMGTIAEEVENRQTAISNLKGTLGEGDAATLEAINDELDTIDAKIGVVPTGKTVVGMIAAAESAAKAAATKMKLAADEAFLTLESTTDKDGAITYAIGTKDLASDAELQAEKDRALGAEARLQAQIGKAATETEAATGLHKEIADVNATIEAMDSTKTGDGNFVDVTVKQVNGVITEVTVAESGIASASDLTAEINARTTDDNAIKGRLNKIEGSGEGSINKAVADAKSELLGNAATDYNTLGKLEDKVLAVEAAAKSYTIKQVTENLGANVKEAYALFDEKNKQSGATINIYKDSSLKGVQLVDQKLQFTYILDSGAESTVDVDVSTFLAESEFKDGLSVNHESGKVSVKVDDASESFLTVGEGGVKISGVQSAIDTAKNAVTVRLDKIEGEETVNGSIKKALKDAKAYTDAEIDKLDAEVTSTDGSHVTVKVTEVDGVITAVNVTESDIASAKALTAEAKAREDADNALDVRLDKIEGEANVDGSIKKALKDAKDYTDAEIAEEVTARTNAIASAKTDLIGSATTEYNTLGKLEGKIKDAEAAAKAAATKLNKASDASHLTLTSVTSTSGEITYTIGESDIASKTALDNEVTARTTDDNAIKGRLNVLEGVTVKGKDAIVVSASGATESKVVSLKLGAQPSEGVAGVVLSQNADGLVAKLQWGTF